MSRYTEEEMKEMKNELLIAFEAGEEEVEAKMASFLAKKAKSKIEVSKKKNKIDEDQDSVDHQNSSDEESFVDSDREASDSEDDEPVMKSNLSRMNKTNPTKPVVFNGEGPDRASNWRTFKIQLALYFKDSIRSGELLSEKRKCEKLVQCLGGKAVTLAETQRLMQLKYGKANFSKLLEVLDSLWLRRDIGELYDEIFSLKQQVDETVSSYYERFIILFDELVLSEEVSKEVAVKWFSNGLADVLGDKVDYRRKADGVLNEFAYNEAHAALLKCMNIASAEECYLKSRGKHWLLNKRSGNPSSSSNTNNHHVKPQVNENRSNSWSKVSNSNKRNESNSTTKRFNLSKDEMKEHIQAGKCFVCHRTGHRHFDCKMNKASLNVMRGDNFSDSDLSDDTSDEEEAAPKPRSKNVK